MTEREQFEATEIFTPGDFPKYTYVERKGEALERRLLDALATRGEIVSVSGPSKSGKTVLVEKVVGTDDLIAVTGAGIHDSAALWNRVLDWMDAPASYSSADSKTSKTSGNIETSGEGSVGIFAKLAAKTKIGHERGRSHTNAQQRARQGMSQVIREIADSSYVLLLDDFHYMPRDVQIEVAREIKEAARQGVKICTASVPHRSDDVVRGNPELRGRVRAIDVGYWSHEDLAKIPEAGFDRLRATLDGHTVQKFLRETSGSPQLMQAVCLQTCFECDLRKTAPEPHSLSPDTTQISSILEEAAARTDFGSLVRDMHNGPKTRGTERKEFRLDDATKGDVYRAVLLSLAKDPATLSFPYNELFNRIQQTCRGEVPQAASIYQACFQIAKIAEDRSPGERIIEWDEDNSLLDIVDPYFLFFLRWSKRLKTLAK